MNASASQPSSTGKRAIVVGAGLGGLASAVRLRAKGYQVQVLEALSDAGGRGRVLRKSGYTFDAGPTVITAPYLIAELFELLGKNAEDYYELMPIHPFYRIHYHDGSQFDYVGDQDLLLEQIRKINPADVEGYLRLAKHAERIFNIGYVKLADKPFDRLTEMLRVVPEMLKLENYRSVYNLVSKYIKDERLRQAFSFQPLLVGGNPFDVTSIYLLIHWLERKWGVFFPKGGTGAVVTALVKLLKEHNVGIEFNTKVSEIIVQNGKACGVISADGRVFRSDIVVCNADPSSIYKYAVPQKWRRKHSDWAVDRKRASMGLFVIYFGAKKKFKDLAHHTIILGPRYRGLLDDIFHKRILAEDFSLYLHAPTVSDPSLAPPGSECFYVLSPVPNNKSGINWSERRDEYMDRILKFLDQTHLPGLLENLEVKFCIDPDYFETDLNSIDGAAFGLEPTFTQSAYFRYHNRSEDIQNLYFVGASTHPGAGIPGVLCSAKVLDRVLDEPSAPAR